MPTQANSSLGIAAARRRKILGRRQKDLINRGHMDAAHFLARASVRADSAGQDDCTPYPALERTLQKRDLLAQMLEDARKSSRNADSSQVSSVNEPSASIKTKNTITENNYLEDGDSNSLLVSSSSSESEDFGSTLEDYLSTREASPSVPGQPSEKVLQANREHIDRSDGDLPSTDDHPVDRSHEYGLFMEDEEWDVARIVLSSGIDNATASSPPANHTKDTARTESLSTSSLNLGISPIKARHDASVSSVSITASGNDRGALGEDPDLYLSMVDCCLNPPFDEEAITEATSTVNIDTARPATTGTRPKQPKPKLLISSVDVVASARTITGTNAVVVQDDPPPSFDYAPPQHKRKSKGQKSRSNKSPCQSAVVILLSLALVSFSAAGVLIYHHFYGPLWGQVDNASDIQNRDEFPGPATLSLPDVGQVYVGEDDFSFYIGADRQEQLDDTHLWPESSHSDGVLTIELGLDDCTTNSLVPESPVPFMVVPAKTDNVFTKIACQDASPLGPLWLRSEKYWPKSTVESVSFDPVYRNFEIEFRGVLFIGLDMVSDDNNSDEMRDRLWHNYDWILRAIDNTDTANVRAIFIFGFLFDRQFLEVLEPPLGTLGVPVVYVFVGTQDDMKLKDRSKDGTWKDGALWSLRLGKHTSGHFEVIVRKEDNADTAEGAITIAQIDNGGLIEFRAP